MDEKFFMQKALALAKSALSAGEFPVGCVMEYNGNIVVTGARKGTSKKTSNEIDHAELIALRNLSRLEAVLNPANITVYSTLEPCLMCYSALLLSGIHKIVYAYEDVMGGGTGCDLSRLTPLYRNRQISIKQGVLRKASLALFKQYFSNPETTYWKGSLLAKYTLEQ